MTCADLVNRQLSLVGRFMLLCRKGKQKERKSKLLMLSHFLISTAGLGARDSPHGILPVIYSTVHPIAWQRASNHQEILKRWPNGRGMKLTSPFSASYCLCSAMLCYCDETSVLSNLWWKWFCLVPISGGSEPRCGCGEGLWKMPPPETGMRGRKPELSCENCINPSQGWWPQRPLKGRNTLTSPCWAPSFWCGHFRGHT